ncbi:MAG: carboxypeptidase regulatory-like domain-containing protein [Bryobacteraceae bacterium]
MLRIAGIALIGVLWGGAASVQGGGIPLLGTIEGRVRNPSGLPQPGAVVVLETRHERVIARTQTNLDGRFRFVALSPDSYTVRVWASAFVPASRQNVPVKAGMESLLAVQLANFFSSIELVSTLPAGSGLVSDDWKWVLRSDSALRPVLRMSSGLPALPSASSSQGVEPLLSGVVQLSGGESAADLTGGWSSLGTSFALATSVFGSRELQISGNVGFVPATGAPSSVFRTRYSSHSGNAPAPDIEFTVRQLGLGERVGQALISGPGAAQEMPTLRSYSMNLQNGQAIGDRMRLEYGLMLEAVEFIDHLNLLSPYAKLEYDLSKTGMLEMAFSSGAPGSAMHMSSTGLPPTDALTDLNEFPRVSLVGGEARLQGSRNFEAGYRLGLGKTTLRASAYREFLSNQAFMLSGDTSQLPSTDLLPDIASNASIYNLGDFATAGYLVSATHLLSDKWSVGASFGQGSALSMDKSLGLAEAGFLRDAARMNQTPWYSTRLKGTLPGSGTHISLAYIWTPTGQVIPTHTFVTQDWQPSMGLSFQLRQPLPAITGMAGRFEVTAEVRNLLAQGYVPVPSGDGHNMLLVPFPRALLGGLSFIF